MDLMIIMLFRILIYFPIIKWKEYSAKEECSRFYKSKEYPAQKKYSW